MLKKSVNALTVAALLLSLGACARIAPLTVDRTGEGAIVADDKNVVLVNHTQWDLDIRKALTKAGFNVKRFASTAETQISDGPISKKFNEAEARYGITQYLGGTVDYCIGAKSVMYDEFTLEVADLKTNNVIMTVQKGGWTGDCGFHSGKLFNELADGLNKNWR